MKKFKELPNTNDNKEITYDQIKEAKELLRKAGYFFSLWHLDDIRQHVQNNGYRELSEIELNEVARGIENCHDASDGINWDVIDTHVLDILQR